MKQKITLFKVLLTLVLLCGVGNAWGAAPTKVIAGWGKVALGPNLTVKASNGDADNKGTACLESNKSLATPGSGNAYYGSSAGGATITMTNLSLSNYSNFQVTFYARASKSGNIEVKGSADGNTYTKYGTVSVSTSESMKTVDLSSMPESVKYIQFVHTATSGSLYFGTVELKGDLSKTIKSLQLGGALSKTDYTEGQSINPDGLSVTATYDDDTQNDVTNNAEFIFNPSTLEVGTKSVKVTAKVGEIESNTLSCDVSVSPFVRTYANTYTSNITEITSNTENYYVEIGGQTYQALKANKGASISITVPANTKTLHVHMVAWNGEGGIDNALGITNIPNVTSQILVADANVFGNNKTYILNEENDPADDYYFSYPMNNEEEVEVKFTAASSKRFVLFGVNTEQFKDVTISSVGYATAYIPFNATISNEANDVKAYYVTVDENSAKLNEIEGTIPAETGVVLKGTGKVTFTESVADPEDVTGNLLIGTTKEGGEDFEDFEKLGYTYYILSSVGGKVGFYWDGSEKYNGREGIGAHCDRYKAVLAVPNKSAGAPSFFTFDDATAINAISNVKTSSVRYNLNGQAVGEDYKGIVIVNGKKMFNK